MSARKRAYDNSSRLAAAEQTRERIMRAMYELLLTDHYDDITMPRIAERAGVSTPTIVLHFRTKEGVFDALLAWWSPKEEELRETPSADPLEAAIKICARYDEAGLATLRMLALEGRLASADRIIAIGRAGHRAWVERTFGKAIGGGAVRERRIAQLVAVYDVYNWHLLRRALSAEDTVTAMAEMARGVLELRKERRR